MVKPLVVSDEEYGREWKKYYTKADPFRKTIRRFIRREGVLLEHFGMMDDAEYVEKSMRKLRLYEKNGYFLGKELLLTFETSQVPFDSRNFENMLKEMGFSGKTW